MMTLRDAFPSRSDRQLQNQFFMVRGIKHLEALQQQTNGMVDVSPLLGDETQSVSVLADLGRIKEGEVFVQAVAWYLRERPAKVKDAVREIRRMRLGKSSPASTRDLHSEIIVTINDYLDRHPDTSREQVRRAVEQTLESTNPESFIKRQQLVRLLVEGITLGRDEDGKTTVEVTYRFGPPKTAQPARPEDYGELEQADEIVVGVEQNSGPREAA